MLPDTQPPTQALTDSHSRAAQTVRDGVGRHPAHPNGEGWTLNERFKSVSYIQQETCRMFHPSFRRPRFQLEDSGVLLAYEL